ncbi:MAG: GSCFA domain-containing protein [Crocinitomicaceae bacterium]|nr:GSCFA domain-containing protein [Crocinitomicaceae bacterium]
MKWQTKLKWELPQKDEITYKSKLLFLGSCFSDNLGKNFLNHGFDAVVNPFGVLFNPISIANVLNVVDFHWDENRVVERDSKFVHLDAHSKVNSKSKSDLLKELSTNSKTLAEDLNGATHLFITLGTAWVYEKERGVVANCHKQDSKQFSRRLLRIDEMERALKAAITNLLETNQALKIYFTVSPIRHTKDGLVDNNRSKARLIEVVHALAQENNSINYLPAYELMMDELRDYRFYAEDLIHPSKAAVNYILEYFRSHFFSSKTAEIYVKHEKLLKLKEHKQINTENSDLSYKMKAMEEEIKKLKSF